MKKPLTKTALFEMFKSRYKEINPKSVFKSFIVNPKCSKYMNELKSNAVKSPVNKSSFRGFLSFVRVVNMFFIMKL